MKKFYRAVLFRQNNIALCGLLALLAFLVAVPQITQNPYYLHVMILCMLFACMVSAWNLIAGYAGVFSFGFQAFFGVGAYTSSLLSIRLGMSPWVSMWIGAFAAMLLGVVVAIPSLKLKQLPYIAISTLCLGEIVRICAANFTGLTRGEMGLTGIPRFFTGASRVPFYYLILLVFVLIILVVYKIVNSPMGMSLNAMKWSQDAAESLGVNVPGTKVKVFMIGSFIAGVVGAFYAHYIAVLTPGTVLGPELMILYIAMSLIGGIGTIVGPIFGAFFITIGLEFLRGAGQFRMISYSILIILTIIFLRAGVWGSIKNMVLEKAEKHRQADAS